MSDHTVLLLVLGIILAVTELSRWCRVAPPIFIAVLRVFPAFCEWFCRGPCALGVTDEQLRGLPPGTRELGR